MANEFKLSYTASDINDRLGKIAFDSCPTSGSDKLITSGNLFNKFVEVNDGIINANTMATLAMPASLKWDGVIGDREHIVVGAEESFNLCYVHVSDEYPAILSQCSAGDTILMGMAIYGADVAASAEIPMTEDGFIEFEAVCIVPRAGYSVEGIVFPRKGIYFMSYHMAPVGMDVSLMYVSALSIMGHSFAETNGGSSNKYFEKKTITTGVGDTLTWDGNTAGLESIDGTYYKVSDVAPTLDDIHKGFSLTTSDGETISLSAEKAAEVTMAEDGIINIVAIVLTQPLTETTSDGTTATYSAGTYFPLDSADEFCVTSLTINDYNGFKTITTEEIIKTEHLPEALRFGEIEQLTEIISKTTVTQSSVSFEHLPLTSLPDTAVFCINGVDYRCSGVYDADNTREIYLFGNIAASEGTGDTGEPFIALIGYNTSQEVYYCQMLLIIPDISESAPCTVSVSIIAPTLVTIDPKYLPEGYGGGSGDSNGSNGSGLPNVTTSDNGKSLKVVNGGWSVGQINYNDLSNKPTYAGSSTVGGAATSADKLNTNAGSVTQPVYFANGVPVATNFKTETWTFTLEDSSTITKSVVVV